MATRKSSPSDVHHLHHFYGTRATQIRTAIEPHRAWIETKLGVPLPDTVILHSDIGFHNAAIQRLLGYIDPKAPIPTARARVADLVQSVEMPHGHIPLYDLTVHRVNGRSDESLIYGAEDAWAYEIEWTDGPVLLQLRNLPTAVIALYAAYHGGPESNDESRQDILIVPKNGLEALISMLKSLHISDGKARLKASVTAQHARLLNAPGTALHLTQQLSAFFATISRCSSSGNAGSATWACHFVVVTCCTVRPGAASQPQFAP